MALDGIIFKEEVDKYRFSHLSGAVNFIPYGVTVDEFQHLYMRTQKLLLKRESQNGER